MRPKILILASALLACVAFGSPAKVDMNIGSLTLKNGKTLKSATIKSYDYTTGNVVITADRSITSVQLELLPDDIAGKVMSIVPPEAKAVARDERLSRETGKRLAQAQEEAARKEEVEEAKAERTARSGAAQIELEQQHRQQELRRVKATARMRASNYFHYEFGRSLSAFVLDTSLDLDEPEAVSGWPDRYRVRGRAGIRYYVNKGSSLNATTREFEILLQKDDKGNLRTVDFSCQ